MSGEIQTQPPQDIIEQFDPERFANTLPAGPEDFATLAAQVEAVTRYFPAEQSNPGTQASRYVRPAGQGDTDPRFRVITDPDGVYLNSGSNFAGRPAVSVTIERGRKGNLRQPSREKGGEAVSLGLTLSGNAVLITEHVARRGLNAVANSGGTTKAATVGLLQEIAVSLGVPEGLKNAPTRAERGLARLGIFGR